MLVKTLPTRQGQYIIKKKKTSKGIYGTATREDLKELKEEGIVSEMIPWVKDNSN